MEKYKSRRHCLLLYPEDESHMRALNYIEQNYEYAYILHDKDIIEETCEIKKSHYHVIIQFRSAKWNSALAKELNITENYIQQCNNFEKALEYLIHYNEESKYQYSIEEVKGNLKKKLINYIAHDGRDENEKSLDIINYIETFNGYLTLKEFSKYCCLIGMWDVYRRSQLIYLKLIEEHNRYYDTIRVSNST